MQWRGLAGDGSRLGFPSEPFGHFVHKVCFVVRARNGPLRVFLPLLADRTRWCPVPRGCESAGLRTGVRQGSFRLGGPVSQNTSLRGMDSEKWSLGVPGSARGGGRHRLSFLVGRFSERTGGLLCGPGSEWATSGRIPSGGGGVRWWWWWLLVSRGGGWALSRLLCSAYPFLSVKACVCFCRLGGWTPLFLGLLHPDRGGVRSSVELLWVVLCCGMPGLRCTFPRC